MRKRAIAWALIGMGLVAFTVFIAIELGSLPWRMFLGLERGADAIPDPESIVLSKDDQGIEVVEDGSLEQEVPKVLPGTTLDDRPPAAYVVLGIIKIPKIEIAQYVLEGTERQLRYGVGHVPGTAQIGEKGNCAVSAHRARGFRYLNLLKPGDEVVFKAQDKIFTYEVTETFVVKPSELWVLETVEGESHLLTMITCTPFATSVNRLIVRARLKQ